MLYVNNDLMLIVFVISLAIFNQRLQDKSNKAVQITQQSRETI